MVGQMHARGQEKKGQKEVDVLWSVAASGLHCVGRCSTPAAAENSWLLGSKFIQTSL